VIGPSNGLSSAKRLLIPNIPATKAAHHRSSIPATSAVSAHLASDNNGPRQEQVPSTERTAKACCETLSLESRSAFSTLRSFIQTIQVLPCLLLMHSLLGPVLRCSLGSSISVPCRSGQLPFNGPQFPGTFASATPRSTEICVFQHALLETSLAPPAQIGHRPSRPVSRVSTYPGPS
jgi:hypothetical protein